MTLTILAAFLAVAAAPPDSTDGLNRQSQILSAVRAYAGPVDASWDSSSVRIEWIDVNGDGREDALVYLTDQDWCGSGGCTVLVFEAMDEIDAEEMGPYRPAAEISLMHGPVLVANARSGEWCDLVVEDETGTARRLSFNGETYPYSPAAGVTLKGSRPVGTTLFAEAR